MIWLWLQSLVLLAATFTLGLWLGHVLSRLTAGRRPMPVIDLAAATEVEAPAPVYHGAEPVPEPLPAVAEPAPPPPPPPRPEPVPIPVAAPMPRVRAAMLFPINQFGVITVTQAPA